MTRTAPDRPAPDGPAPATSPDADPSLGRRLRETPRPALLWAVVGLLLLAPEVGALLHAGVELLAVPLRLLPVHATGVLGALDRATASVPTLLSRSTVPNGGHWDGQRWVGTFAGLEPKQAWLLRVGLVYAYAFAVLGWLWSGYRRFRRHYRRADWTPRDDALDRLRRHRWGQFGLVVVAAVVVMAVFAPALGPTTVERNVLHPYEHELTYWDADAGQTRTVLVGDANLESQSRNTPENVGPWAYDDFGRFHPFGTTPNGKDLFTFVATGARVSLSVAGTAVVGAALLALALSLLTAYYRGLADLLVVFTSDAVQALPLLVLLILVLTVFQGSRLAEFYDGAVLLVGVFVLAQWPFLWRAIRGPALRVADAGWVDAARAYDQRPRAIMRRHMAPYVVGYLFVYGSMSLGGIVLAVAGLSFLGLGIDAPTPEWGRLIVAGQPYVATRSWHVSLLPGLVITLVVTGFNALGDGVRDAIDPQSAGGDAAEATMAGGGNA
ncbi:MAG: ABC transporter permease [Haloferacaceae archaeon]